MTSEDKSKFNDGAISFPKVDGSSGSLAPLTDVSEEKGHKESGGFASACCCSVCVGVVRWRCNVM